MIEGLSQTHSNGHYVFGVFLLIVCVANAIWSLVNPASLWRFTFRSAIADIDSAEPTSWWLAWARIGGVLRGQSVAPSTSSSGTAGSARRFASTVPPSTMSALAGSMPSSHRLMCMAATTRPSDSQNA